MALAFLPPVLAPGAVPVLASAAESLPLTSIRTVMPSLDDIYRRAVGRPAEVPA